MKICRRNHTDIAHQDLECPLCKALNEVSRLKPDKGSRLNKHLLKCFQDAMLVYPGEHVDSGTEFKNFIECHKENWRFIVKRLASDIAEQRRGGKKEWPPLGEYLLIKGWLSDDN